MKKENDQGELEMVAKTATDILLAFDRLPDNPDKLILSRRVKEQLKNDGVVTLSVFGCLDWIKSKLFTSTPEEFIADSVRNSDLFMPRVPKINELTKKMQSNGIATNVYVILGDTDVREYFEMILNTANVFLKKEKLSERIQKYIFAFTDRVQKAILTPSETILWSDTQNLFNEIETFIPEEISQESLDSMIRAYTGDSYKGLYLKPEDDVFLKANQKRIDMYSKQGVMVDQMLNGIVLQTETPWVLSSKLLKLNSPNLPIIYPWIRKKELGTI